MEWLNDYFIDQYKKTFYRMTYPPIHVYIVELLFNWLSNGYVFFFSTLIFAFIFLQSTLVFFHSFVVCEHVNNFIAHKKVGNNLF